MQKVKQCPRCILPETFPGITFNEEGVCNFCLNHKHVAVLGESKLKEILGTERGKVYDCVVPISGGKDSTYILYYAVRILKLRVIAVNYDSGFQSDLAKQNLKNICRILNVPLVVKGANYQNQEKMLAQILRMSEILGTFFHICGNCETNIRTVAINIAKQYEAPFILYGSSLVEEAGSHSFTGMKALAKTMLRTKRNWIELLIHVTKFCFYSVRQRIQMKVPLRYRFIPIGTLSLPNKGIRFVRFFDYVEWNQIDKVSFLEEKLGWRCPDNHPHRFDCLLHCFGNHHWLQQSGITLDGFNYSTMIRENCIKRGEAILAERVARESLGKECVGVIQRVGLKDYKMPQV